MHLPSQGACQRQRSEQDPTGMEGPAAASLAWPLLRKWEEPEGCVFGQEGSRDHHSSC